MVFEKDSAARDPFTALLRELARISPILRNRVYFDPLTAFFLDIAKQRCYLKFLFFAFVCKCSSLSCASLLIFRNVFHFRFWAPRALSSGQRRYPACTMIKPNRLQFVHGLQDYRVR